MVERYSATNKQRNAQGSANNPMSKNNAKVNKGAAIGASIPPVPKTNSAAVVADAVKGQGPSAVVNALAVLPAPKGKRISHLKLGLSLAERNAPQSEIDAAFLASFVSRGKDAVKDAVWIAARRDIYMRIGRGKVAQRMPVANSVTK